MLTAYLASDHGLSLLPEGARLRTAAWIDALQPSPDDIAALARLGVDVPTLADMEEIEVSNRLYTENGMAYMTGVLPVPDGAGRVNTSPVAFILDENRLVTVRHHSPRPFETFPARADRSSCGASDPERIFLGLVEEIVGRLADMLETVGAILDQASAEVLGPDESTAAKLRALLVRIGQAAEKNSRVRLCLMTLERMLAYHQSLTPKHSNAARLRGTVEAIHRDIHALEVHSDFLSSRVSLSVDATLGMINLQQNTTSKALSVVAALFLPPTLIASTYGMNFQSMPELTSAWGYPAVLACMVLSSVVTYLLFRWRNWL
ncbi:magnesium transporter CorA family protein [Paracoccus sp. DMF-8]|uniref:magnesium transporter CorA family protein n=1 Tax=Paracoccus sp. DMF-8 TaxID=3019445 RepID=UPI0023E3880D|nr:magnesium transporter CorA family protein [Paracoccus sp. DMF-8]MDF3607408.1 magnesium transporter CorA family protein [Paracoccus sp. DMF-8]